MKKVFFSLLLAVLLFGASKSNSQQQFNGLSKAVLASISEGENITLKAPPDTSVYRTVWAGPVWGSIDGHFAKFYCMDLRGNLFFPDSCHVDLAVALSKLVYIVNEYYPNNPDPVGKLSSLNKEAAATQAAIWHLSDTINLNTITDIEIRNRALEIVADANMNGSAITIPVTLSIHSSADPSQFHIRTKDQNGDPIAVSGIAVSISDGGVLDTNTVSTNASGFSPDITVVVDGTTITATAMAVIPAGVMYACTGSQLMILAVPVLGKLEASVPWGALPVELSSFNASVQGNTVVLNWTTTKEENNAGFNIERKSVQGGWITIANNIAGNGTTDLPQAYSFSDRQVPTGSYNYRLKQIDYNGNFKYYNLNNEVVIGVPNKFTLNQNYPNPFNPVTQIQYSLPHDGAVQLTVFDVSGKEVKNLVQAYQPAGYYTVSFNGADLNSGTYFYVLKIDGFTETKKMMLIK